MALQTKPLRAQKVLRDHILIPKNKYLRMVLKVCPDLRCFCSIQPTRANRRMATDSITYPIKV